MEAPPTIFQIKVADVSWGIDIFLVDPQDGYFLKPVYRKKQLWDPLTHKEDFIITRPSDNYALGVQSGTYKKEQVIPQDISALYSGPTQEYNRVHHDAVFGMDVSAHLVTAHLSPKYPKLQVLIHASPRDEKKQNKKSKFRTTNPTRVSTRSLCGHIFVRQGKEELSSICALSLNNGACVNAVILPSEWWHRNASVQVYYAFSQKDENQECASASNSIVPGRMFEKPKITDRQLLTNLILTTADKNFHREVEQDILIDVPTDFLNPNTQFEVPVRLKGNSDIRNFIMSARVRQGLKITGAVVDADSPWEIHVDVNSKKNTATVTTFLKEFSKYKKSPTIQDVFRWQLKVDSDIKDIEASRIIWSIKYERDSKTEWYLPSESRLVTRVNLRGKEPERLVTVLKVDEILNMALLTGKKQAYPLKVFMVKESDRHVNIQRNVACHSQETDVLKVEQDCSYVYVDGTERRGSHNVTIITKSGQHTAFTFVKVWIPMDPLDIQITDQKLSRIRSWKVGGPRNKRRSRSKRVVDFGILTHPSVYLSKKSKKYGSGCQLRLQQALIDVYATFYISTPSGPVYYVDRHAALKITDLLKDQIRVSDPRIVSLDGRVIQGQSQGRTEVQVLSAGGRVIAGKEVRVANDKVSIERLIVNVVTRINLSIKPSKDIPGAWSSDAHIYSKFHNKWQDGILDMHLQFSDGTKFPLDHVSATDYFLDVENRNQRLIKVAAPVASNPYLVKIYAITEGRTESLRVSLKQGSSCPKRRPVELSVGYVTTEADFSQTNQVNEPFLMDGFHNNRPSDRYTVYPKQPYDLRKSASDTNKQKLDKSFKQKSSKFPKPSHQDVFVVSGEFEKDIAKETQQTKQEPLQSPKDSKLSPMEIGMYVLLAVFCVAISVFLVNCIVFFVRHKKKRKIHKKSHKEPVYQAKDWVWIGRATLERSAVKTECSQSLMPAEDFNGNHTRASSSQSSSSQNSANNSNRNSFVSTIKGSECSIRITANPLSEEVPRTSDSVSQSSAPPVAAEHWDYEALGLTYDQLSQYFDNLKESSA